MARMISRQEAARMLDVTPMTVSNWMSRGVIKGRKVNGRVMVDKSTVERYFADFRDLASAEAQIGRMRRMLDETEAGLDARLRDFRSACLRVHEGSPSGWLGDIMDSVLEVAGEEILSGRERDILLRVMKGEELKSLCRSYGLSRERMVQIVNKAIGRLGAMKDFACIYRENKCLKEQNGKLRSVVVNLERRLIETERRLARGTDESMRLKPHMKGRGGAMIDLLDTRLDGLELSNRTKNCLCADGVVTLGNLVACSRQAVLRLRNMGKKSVRELDGLLDRYGLSWDMDVPALVHADTMDWLNRKKEGREE